MDDEVVLRVNGLTKEYPNGVRAVDSLDLELKRGEVFGILGPNGSGKTTTILMLLGLTEPAEGQVDILGLNPLRSPLEVKKRVAYMPDTVGFYEELSGYDNLDYTARFLGLETRERKRRVEESLEKMGLRERMHYKVQTYSHGMRRRLGLAEVICKKPEIAILDEPTQGLDPENAAEFLELIEELKREERISILLSSHLLDQVETVCDRVGLFSKGKLLISGTVAELSSRIMGGKYAVILKADGREIKNRLEKIKGVYRVEEREDFYFHIECEEDVRPTIVEEVIAGGGRIYELSIQRHSLDTIYRAYFKEVAHAA